MAVALMTHWLQPHSGHKLSQAEAKTRSRNRMLTYAITCLSSSPQEIRLRDEGALLQFDFWNASPQDLFDGLRLNCDLISRILIDQW